MPAEFAAAVLAVVYLAVAILMAAVEFRFIVPLILNSHFYGSPFLAAVVGIASVISLILFGFLAVKHVSRVYAGVEERASSTETTDK
jgi:uncharacterized membrane protein